LVGFRVFIFNELRGYTQYYKINIVILLNRPVMKAAIRRNSKDPLEKFRRK